MLKVSHATLVLISGCIWLMIGLMLLYLGVNFIIQSIFSADVQIADLPLLSFIDSYINSLYYAALILVFVAVMIGSLKGKFVFAKTVRRSVYRILSLPSPVAITKIYAGWYYLLLAFMVAIGFAIRFVPLDVRGAIDVAVGSALIQGSLLYFRQVVLLRCTTT